LKEKSSKKNMKKQRIHPSVIGLKGYLAALFILTLAGFTLAQTSRSSAKEPTQRNKVTLIFINQTSYEATITPGKEDVYALIPAGETFQQVSTASQPWSIAVNGKPVGKYVTTSAPVQEIEISVSKSEAPVTIRNQKDAEKHCKPFMPGSKAVWIGKWGSLGEGQMSYCEFASLRFSRQTEAASDGPAPNATVADEVQIAIENQTHFPIQLFAVNGRGAEKLSGNIEAGAGFTESTAAGQKLRFKFPDGRTFFEWTVRENGSGKLYIQSSESLKIGKVKNQKEADEKCVKSGPTWAKAVVRSDREALCEGVGWTFIPNPRSRPNPNGTTPKEVTINFVNKTKVPVELFWIEESGKETSYGQVAAGAAQTQNTYVAHKWRLKIAGGVTFGEYTATDQNSQKVEIGYDLIPVKQIRNRKEAEQECNKVAASKGGFWTGNWAEVGDSDVPVCRLIRLRTGAQSK
jgi:hypothetical protein